MGEEPKQVGGFGSMGELLQVFGLFMSLLKPVMELLEKMLTDAGIKITETAVTTHNGLAFPLLTLNKIGEEQSDTKVMKLDMTNAFYEIMTVDRDEVPMRLDPRLQDSEYLAHRVVSVLLGRVELAKAILSTNDPDELRAKIAELQNSGRFERIRSEQIDPQSEKAHKLAQTFGMEPPAAEASGVH